MRLPETPEGFKRVSGYPRGSRKGGIDTLADSFSIPSENFSLDSLYVFDELSFNELVVNDCQWLPSPNFAHIFVTVAYGLPNQQGSSATEGLGKPSYELSDTGHEIPIGKRKKNGDLWFPNYRTIHNHILVGAPGVTASESWISSKTDLKLDESFDDKLRWIESPDAMPEGWHIIKDKTKNIETVLKSYPVVTETKHFDNYAQAVKNIEKTGTKKKPAKTFNHEGEWIVESSGLSDDGKFYTVTTNYQISPEWDGDYYETD